MFIPLLNPVFSATAVGGFPPIPVSYAWRTRGLEFSGSASGDMYLPLLNPRFTGTAEGALEIATPEHTEVPESIVLRPEFTGRARGRMFLPLLNPVFSAVAVGDARISIFQPATGVIFRTAPDRVVLRGRTVGIDTPTAVNALGGGLYAVRGLPAGLRQEGDRIVGSTRAPAGSYEIGVSFIWPVTPIDMAPATASASGDLDIATPTVTRAA